MSYVYISPMQISYKYLKKMFFPDTKRKDQSHFDTLFPLTQCFNDHLVATSILGPEQKDNGCFSSLFFSFEIKEIGTGYGFCLKLVHHSSPPGISGSLALFLSLLVLYFFSSPGPWSFLAKFLTCSSLSKFLSCSSFAFSVPDPWSSLAQFLFLLVVQALTSLQTLSSPSVIIIFDRC